MNGSHSGSQLSTSCFGAFQNPQGSSLSASHPISCSQYRPLSVWVKCYLSPVSFSASFCFHLGLASLFQGCHSIGGTQQTQTSGHFSSSLSSVPQAPPSAGLPLPVSGCSVLPTLSGPPSALSSLWQVPSCLWQLRLSILDFSLPLRPVPFLMAPTARVRDVADPVLACPLGQGRAGNKSRQTL